MFPELAVSNAFTDGSFWNNSSFPHSTDPLELRTITALCRRYCPIRRVRWGTEAVALAASVGAGPVYP